MGARRRLAHRRFCDPRTMVGALPPAGLCCLEQAIVARHGRLVRYEIALAMPKAAAAARPPMTTVWMALRTGLVPVKWPLT